MQRKEKILLERTRPGVLRYRLSFNGEAPQWKFLSLRVYVWMCRFKQSIFYYFSSSAMKNVIFIQIFFLPSCHSALPMQHKEKKEWNKEKLFPQLNIAHTTNGKKIPADIPFLTEFQFEEKKGKNTSRPEKSKIDDPVHGMSHGYRQCTFTEGLLKEKKSCGQCDIDLQR